MSAGAIVGAQAVQSAPSIIRSLMPLIIIAIIFFAGRYIYRKYLRTGPTPWYEKIPFSPF